MLKQHRLFKAVRENNFNEVKKAMTPSFFGLIKGAVANSMEEQGDDSTVLMVACSWSDKPIVEFLINNGADINHKSSFSRTALMSASENDREDIVKLLINSGSDINAADKYGETALMYAAKNGCKRSVEILINNGANINAIDEFGNAAIDFASDNFHRNIVKLLADEGSIHVAKCPKCNEIANCEHERDDQDWGSSKTSWIIKYSIYCENCRYTDSTYITGGSTFPTGYGRDEGSNCPYCGKHEKYENL